jgi:hypothetical protein
MGYKLPSMSSSCVKAALIFCLSIVFASCNSDHKSASSDSSNLAISTRPLSQSSRANTGWNDTDAGPIMILAAADNPLSAAVVLPGESDSTLAAMSAFQLDSLADLPVDLFGAGNTVGESSLKISSQKAMSEGCVAWPVAQLSSQPAVSWRVGFVKGRATPLQLDSIDGMTSADSASITTELARLASASSVKSDPAFRGLPFIVEKGYRTTFGKTSILIGSIVRKINEEATPRVENLLLVAEKENESDDYATAFQSRTSGTEDDVRTNAVIAAVHFVHSNRAALVVSFEYDDGGQVALLERVADHDWRITWRSAYTGC